MADDTTLIIKVLNSLSIAIEHFKLFQTCSGLKLNLNKTELLPIGSNRNIILPNDLSNIPIQNGPFKALGVWFMTDEEESIRLNFSERIKNMKTLTNIWNSRQLSLKGKIIILKTLILPQIQISTWIALRP